MLLIISGEVVLRRLLSEILLTLVLFTIGKSAILLKLTEYNKAPPFTLTVYGSHSFI
jgi:hypothetical protein